jgi:hypothetical protein
MTRFTLTLTAAFCVLVVCGTLTAARAGAEPMAGMTLLPGTYHLTWEIPKIAESFDPKFPFSSPGENRYLLPLKPANANLNITITGLESRNAFAGFGGGFLVIVDESKGTGTGYDTAYIIRSKAGIVRIDVALAEKVMLRENPDKFYGAAETDSMLSMVEKPGELLTWICTGRPGGQATEQAAVDGFNICLKRTGGKAKPCEADVTLRGGWFGAVKTSNGELRVRATDDNGNGVYGDRPETGWETGEKSCGDAVTFSPPEGPSGEDIVVILGQAEQVAGKLYSIDVNPVGDSIDVKPYSGDTGLLRVGGIDGKGKPARCENISFFGDNGDFSTAGLQPAESPTGKYWCSAFIAMEKSEYGEDQGVFVVTPQQSTLTKNAMLKFSMGGHIRLQLAKETGVIKARSGKDEEIELIAYAGRDIMHFAMPDHFMATITDAHGKTVARLPVGNRRMQVRCSQAFTIPKSLKPGSYMVDVQLDARPYDEPVSMKMKLIVEK